MLNRVQRFPFSRSLSYENSAVVYRKPHGLLCLLKERTTAHYGEYGSGLCYRWLNVRRCIYCRWPFFIAFLPYARLMTVIQSDRVCLCARLHGVRVWVCTWTHEALRRYRTAVLSICTFALSVHPGSVFIFHFYVLSRTVLLIDAFGVGSTAARRLCHTSFIIIFVLSSTPSCSFGSCDWNTILNGRTEYGTTHRIPYLTSLNSKV